MLEGRFISIYNLMDWYKQVLQKIECDLDVNNVNANKMQLIQSTLSISNMVNALVSCL